MYQGNLNPDGSPVRQRLHNGQPQVKESMSTLLRKSRLGLLPVACLAIASAQTFDNSADSSLSGNYFLREVLLSNFDANGNFSRARSLSGTMTFDGKGNYSFAGLLIDSAQSSGQATGFSTSGTYGVQPNGLAEIDPLLDQSLSSGQDLRKIFGAVTQSIFVG